MPPVFKFKSKEINIIGPGSNCRYMKALNKMLFHSHNLII